MIGRRSTRSCHSDRTELVSLDCLFILWVYSFELPSTSSTHCPEREPKTGPFIPGKTHRGICRAWGTNAQSRLRQKLHGDRMPSITHTRNLIDSPPCTLPAPAGLCFRFAIRIAGWRILPLIISPVFNPTVLKCTTHAGVNIRTGSSCTSPPR